LLRMVGSRELRRLSKRLFAFVKSFSAAGPSPAESPEDGGERREDEGEAHELKGLVEDEGDAGVGARGADAVDRHEVVQPQGLHQRYRVACNQPLKLKGGPQEGERPGVAQQPVGKDGLPVLGHQPQDRRIKEGERGLLPHGHRFRRRRCLWWVPRLFSCISASSGAVGLDLGCERSEGRRGADAKHGPTEADGAVGGAEPPPGTRFFVINKLLAMNK